MIRLSLNHLQDINTQAEQAYPKESCGLLAGRQETDGTTSVSRVVPSTNLLAKATGQGGQERFEIDPQVRFDLMRALRDTDERIIGHYHSHPDHPAQPSEHDLDMAFEPDLVWLITATAQGQAEQTRAWRLNRDTRKIEEVTLQVGQSN